MSILDSIILGFVQGLTEFLPISSSGHLVLFQKILGIQGSSLLFDTLLHIGTLIAVFVVFWDDIVEMVKDPFHNRLLGLIIIGTIPTAAIGLAFKNLFDKLFASGSTLGFEFIISGIILWYADSVRVRWPKKLEQTSMGDAFFVGIMQGVAILPAISRSGLTIAGSLFRGLDKKFAAKFSFLMSIPAILGAAVVQVKDINMAAENTPIFTMILGVIVAAIVGYIAIKFMVDLIVRGKLKGFSIYLFIIGLYVILDQHVFHMFF